MDIFVARQPILDRTQKVFAYELLFRSGYKNFFDCPDRDLASSKVISNSFFSMGIETITGGKKAFVNITKNVLLHEYITILPRESTVIELLEEIEPDEQVVASCKKLKKQGFILALDDFVYNDKLTSLIDLADIIKVDFLATEVKERGKIVQRCGTKGIKFVAEKVETHAEFQQAMAMGYTYFQGYFFSKPTILSRKDIPSFKLHYLRILQEINHPELDFNRIEEIIKRDISITYKLLKYANSAAFAGRCQIHSIRRALVRLGGDNIKKIISIIALTGMGTDKPDELLTTSIVRAKFCELLSPLIGLEDRSSELFLLGMFSLIDAIMDQPLSDIMTEIPLSSDIKNALSGTKNQLRDAYEFIVAYEKGDWKVVSARQILPVSKEKEIPNIYFKSIEWANQIGSVR